MSLAVSGGAAGLARSAANDIARVRREYFATSPWLVKLVATKPVVITEGVPTAAVSRGGEILVNPAFWASLRDGNTKKFVLLHEALHLELRHHERLDDMPVRVPELWNIVTDAVINDVLLKVYPGTELADRVVTTMDVYRLLSELSPDIAKRIPYDRFKRLGEEEMYMLLLRAVNIGSDRAGERVGETVGKTVEGGSLVGDPGEPLARVEPDVRVDGPATEEEKRRRIAEAVEALRGVLRGIGVRPGEASELLDRLRPRGRVDWSNYLVSLVSDIVFGDVVHTYHRPSRRFEGMPGRKWITRPGVNAVFLVDVSGSVDSETLRAFIEETLHAKSVLGDALRGYVVTWDVGVRSVIPLERLEAEGRVEITGRGGTVIDGALRKVIEMSEGGRVDLVVVLTDGLIDLEDESLPAEVLKNVGVGVVVYTIDEPPGFDGWTKIKY